MGNLTLTEAPEGTGSPFQVSSDFFSGAFVMVALL
jgi:hypothetical protein